MKEIYPSLLTSKSMKKSDGEQRNSPGFLSPLKYPSLTRLDSDGGKTGTTALMRSSGLISNSPSDVQADAKYSNTYMKQQRTLVMKVIFLQTQAPTIKHFKNNLES